MNVTSIKMDDGILLKIEGRVDTLTSPHLQDEILGAFKKTGNLVLDFEEVDYVSSAGLRALLIGEKTAKGKHGMMKLVHVAAPVRSVFDITGFSKILKIE